MTPSCGTNLPTTTRFSRRTKEKCKENQGLLITIWKFYRYRYHSTFFLWFVTGSEIATIHKWRQERWGSLLIGPKKGARFSTQFPLLQVSTKGKKNGRLVISDTAIVGQSVILSSSIILAKLANRFRACETKPQLVSLLRLINYSQCPILIVVCGSCKTSTTPFP